MDMKAVILLVGVDDGPFLGVAEVYHLIYAVLFHDPAVNHEDFPIRRP